MHDRLRIHLFSAQVNHNAEYIIFQIDILKQVNSLYNLTFGNKISSICKHVIKRNFVSSLNYEIILIMVHTFIII